MEQRLQAAYKEVQRIYDARAPAATEEGASQNSATVVQPVLQELDGVRAAKQLITTIHEYSLHRQDTHHHVV